MKEETIGKRINNIVREIIISSYPKDHDYYCKKIMDLFNDGFIDVTNRMTNADRGKIIAFIVNNNINDPTNRFDGDPGNMADALIEELQK